MSNRKEQILEAVLEYEGDARAFIEGACWADITNKPDYYNKIIDLYEKFIIRHYPYLPKNGEYGILLNECKKLRGEL